MISWTAALMQLDFIWFLSLLMFEYFTFSELTVTVKLQQNLRLGKQKLCSYTTNLQQQSNIIKEHLPCNNCAFHKMYLVKEIRFYKTSLGKRIHLFQNNLKSSTLFKNKPVYHNCKQSGIQQVSWKVFWTFKWIIVVFENIIKLLNCVLIQKLCKYI